MPKWMVHNMRDSKLDASLSSRTRSSSHYALVCYALDVLIMCDKEETVSFYEAQNSKNWMAVMRVEFDAIV